MLKKFSPGVVEITCLEVHQNIPSIFLVNHTLELSFISCSCLSFATWEDEDTAIKEVIV